MYKTYRIAVVEETFAAHGRAIIRGVATYVDQGCRWELHAMSLGKNGVEVLKTAMQADGVITRPYSREMAAICQTAPRPLVAVHYRGDLPIPTAGVNPDSVAAMALDHLASQGLRQFAFFGPPEKTFSLERAAAFQRATAARGFPCQCYFAGRIEPENFDWHAPGAEIVRWLRGLP